VVVKSEENPAQLKHQMTQDEVRAFKRRLIRQIIPNGSAAAAAADPPLRGAEPSAADEAMICFLEEKCQLHKRRRRAMEAELAKAQAAVGELRATLERERGDSQRSGQSLLDALVLLEQDLWAAEKAREDRKDDLFEFVRRARARIEEVEPVADPGFNVGAVESASSLPLPSAGAFEAALRSRRGTDASVVRTLLRPQSQGAQPLRVPAAAAAIAANAANVGAVAAGDDRPYLRLLEERRRVRRDRELEMKDELIRALQVRWNDERRGLERELAEERQRRAEAEERAERVRREADEERRVAAGRTWESARRERQERKAREARLAAQGGQESLAADSHFIKIVAMALYNMRYEKDSKELQLPPPPLALGGKAGKKDKANSGSGIFVTGADGRPSLIPLLRSHRESNNSNNDGDRTDGGGNGGNGSSVPVSPTTVVTVNPLMAIPGVGTPVSGPSSASGASTPVSPLVRRETENSMLTRRRDTAYASTSLPLSSITLLQSPHHHQPLSGGGYSSGTGSALASPSFLEARRYDSLLPPPRRRSTFSTLAPPSLATPLPAAAPGLAILSASSSAALLAATTASPRRGPFMSNISSTLHTLPTTTPDDFLSGGGGGPGSGALSARQQAGLSLTPEVAAIGTVSAAVVTGSPVSARRTSFITQLRLPSLLPSSSSSPSSSNNTNNSLPSPSSSAASAPLQSPSSSTSTSAASASAAELRDLRESGEANGGGDGGGGRRSRAGSSTNPSGTTTTGEAEVSQSLPVIAVTSPASSSSTTAFSSISEVEEEEEGEGDEQLWVPDSRQLPVG
jgi:hypothetical protein